MQSVDIILIYFKCFIVLFLWTNLENKSYGKSLWIVGLKRMRQFDFLTRKLRGVTREGKGGLPCYMWVKQISHIHLVGQCQFSLPVLFIASETQLSQQAQIRQSLLRLNYLYIQLALFLQAVLSFFAQVNILSLSAVQYCLTEVKFL